MTFSDFIQRRLNRLINNEQSTEIWHLFKDKLREKAAISQIPCPTAKLFKVFETLDELNLDFLPPSFVIKLTFQSLGRGIVIVENGIDQRTQKPYDLDDIKEFMKKYTLSPNAIIKYQKVMIEELLLAEIPNTPLLDIKLFYFAGEMLFLQVINSEERTENRVYPRFHYDKNWDRIIVHKEDAPLDQNIEKPKCFKDILKMGDKISKLYFNDTFIRLDFYPTNKGVVFGETTITPNFDCTDYINNMLGKILIIKKITY